MNRSLKEFTVLCLVLLSFCSSAQDSARMHIGVIDPYTQYVKSGISSSDYKNDTLKQFFSEKWEKNSKEGAFFYALAYPMNGGWACENYDLFDGKIFSYIVYADQNLTILNGPFYSFHSNDSVASRGKYVNNNKQGLWVSYDDHGKITDSSRYNKGNLIGNSYWFFSSGKISRNAILDSEGTGTFTAYHENGGIRKTGFYSNAKWRDSTWTYYYPNGKVSYIEQYKDDSCLSVKCYDETGNLKDSCETSKMPEFPGGSKGLQKFLSQNIKWPAGITFTNIDRARVVARFAIGSDGAIGDIKIIRHVARPFDREVIRVLKKMPKWKPGLDHNEAVPVYYTLPVSFRQ